MAEGWGFPQLSRKAHYFRDGRSLCRKWMFWGAFENNQQAESPDDCADCKRRRAKEAARDD